MFYKIIKPNLDLYANGFSQIRKTLKYNGNEKNETIYCGSVAFLFRELITLVGSILLSNKNDI